VLTSQRQCPNTASRCTRLWCRSDGREPNEPEEPNRARPVPETGFSRLVSLEHPMEIRTGMVFALETYCPASDGFSAARIEEEVVVTDKGCKVITRFPAEELPIANAY
jgi:Xaa-Pro aminopeptidase